MRVSTSVSSDEWKQLQYVSKRYVHEIKMRRTTRACQRTFFPRWLYHKGLSKMREIGVQCSGLVRRRNTLRFRAPAIENLSPQPTSDRDTWEEHSSARAMVRCQEPTYCSTICRARGFSRRLAHEESPRKRAKAGKKEIGKDASYRGRVFPTSAITILALCMAVHSFTFVSLFPYVGIMTCQLLGLDSTNEAGEAGPPKKIGHFCLRIQRHARAV